MDISEVLGFALAAAIPLLTLAYTFGRLSQKADGIKESVDKGFKMLGRREDAQDELLVQHHGRLVSLEEWRKMQERER